MKTWLFYGWIFRFETLVSGTKSKISTVYGFCSWRYLQLFGPQFIFPDTFNPYQSKHWVVRVKNNELNRLSFYVIIFELSGEKKTKRIKVRPQQCSILKVGRKCIKLIFLANYLIQVRSDMKKECIDYETRCDMTSHVTRASILHLSLL